MATTISVIGLLLAAIIFVVAIWKGLDVFTSTIRFMQSGMKSSRKNIIPSMMAGRQAGFYI